MNIKKVSYKENYTSLDEFYLKNPREATFYNIVDVILIIGLDNKNKHVDIHNTVRRAMKCPFHTSLLGSSAFYDSFVFSRLDSTNQKVRCNITTEGNLSFAKEYTEQFGPIKGSSKVKELLPIQIGSKEFVGISRKFPGAYVKQPNPEIIANNSLVIDLDATSMYPSNILQGNISFDCYIARIIPPQCYSTIKVLMGSLGTGKYPPSLQVTVQKMVRDHVNDKKLSPKNENIQKFYYSTLSLFAKLMESGKTFDQICNPRSSEESILLRTILVPLLDIIFTIHPTSPVYNDFVYDYVYLVDKSKSNWQDNRDLMQAKYPDGTWVIYNPNESNTSMAHLTIDQTFEYIQQNSISFSGCMFLKHSVKKGLFVEMLTEFGNLRKHHKKLRDTYTEGGIEYKFEDNNQNVFKRVMNTSYGLYGMSGFRYSNHWLARSITNNSLHALKVAMYIGEDYLTKTYG